VVRSVHGDARGAIVTRVRVARSRHQLAASTAKTERAPAPPLAPQILHTSNHLEGTHRVRYHADDWLRHLANHGSSMQNRLIGPMTLTFDL